MTKPEPSERLSARGAGPCPWPGCPGPGWRGMKRRKNSSTSSSSMPGTCGSAALRRTTWVVLMLTTALPCSSTTRVKSGRSRWATAAMLNAASHRAASALIVLIGLSSFFLRPPVFDGIPYALHAGRRRFADDRDHVVRHLPRIDMDRAQARETRALGLAAPLQRLDEHRHGREAVGIHHLTHRLRLAQPARELDHLVEPGQLRGETPAREARGRCLRVLDAETRIRVARLHHVRRDVTEAQLSEGELLDLIAG